MKGKINLSNKERRILILNDLLTGKHLSYQQLSDQYFVSRSSIANDISYIKNILASEWLQLNFDNSGTYFTGTEIDAQRVLKRILLTESSKKGNNPVLENLINLNLFYKISDAITAELKNKHIIIPENNLEDIIATITILIQRGYEGKHVKNALHNQIENLLFQYEKYPIVFDLLETLEKKNFYSFTKNEINYLSYVILGNGFKFFIKDNVIPSSIKLLVKKLMNQISGDIQIDFSNDLILKNDLLVHIYQMILRLQGGTTVVNPLLKDIKKQYSALYGVIWYNLNNLAAEEHIHISDDEVGFVTIHFQAAKERIHKLNRILFVCPNGIGMSTFISAKLKQILPESEIIEVVSAKNIPSTDLNNVQLIITTVSLPKLKNIPVVKISPMITNNDMHNVINQYLNISIDKNNEFEDRNKDLSKALKFLNKNVYFKSINNQEESINFLLDQYNWSNFEVKKNYQSSVFEREEMQTTYLDNGFAIPHGDSKY
ncbi:BglG family transcription antiterminator [Xylocopilactobacillus apis]|uniref:Transcriptional antiterminator n=1 Tax=Xylocopilactobacillus apis TaxID=2932183 RepID=A0AAU9CTV6_9LACO|nr:PRD domain-containing protein [Xylocopilactobacillus apis]BDR57434.1 hypothetical protein KIMC2_19960 [Xylocopilactobacillus apis]